MEFSAFSPTNLEPGASVSHLEKAISRQRKIRNRFGGLGRRCEAEKLEVVVLGRRERRDGVGIVGLCASLRDSARLNWSVKPLRGTPVSLCNQSAFLSFM